MKKLVLISVLVLGSYVLAQESPTQSTRAKGTGKVELAGGEFLEVSFSIIKYPPNTGRRTFAAVIFRKDTEIRKTELSIVLFGAESVRLDGDTANISGLATHATKSHSGSREQVLVAGRLQVVIEDRKPANGGPDLPGDFYRLRFESNDHQLVYESEGVLTSGDINLQFAP